MRQVDPIFREKPMLRHLQSLTRLFSRCYHSVELISRCTVPPVGPAIVAANHISHLDPVLIQSTCDRPIAWMMAAEFLRLEHWRWLFDLIEIVPVERGNDRTSVRNALRRLEAGRVVGIFPEGRIQPSHQLLPLSPGLFLIASRAKLPIHPVRIEGTMRRTTLETAYLLPRQASICWKPQILETSDQTQVRQNLEHALG